MTPLRILLAEDDPLTRETIIDILETEGYEMHVATDGTEAVDIARVATIDVLVTDIQMPRMCGDKLVSLLRSENPALPVVVITGFASAAAYGSLASVPGRPPRILLKPFPMNCLVEAIQGAASETTPHMTAA